mmetsp:Transcript_2126/g.3053  ORF Transcript_2126/g.3053 Transcript_2126/m.3053 type:complete len:116 (-) Transcript_2126:98-445(-)
MPKSIANPKRDVASEIIMDKALIGPRSRPKKKRRSALTMVFGTSSCTTLLSSNTPPILQSFNGKIDHLRKCSRLLIILGKGPVCRVGMNPVTGSNRVAKSIIITMIDILPIDIFQ